MRTIEKNMLNALREKKTWRNSNTAVVFNEDKSECRVYLHGNCIFAVCEGVARFTLAGWNSKTTRSRLNALGVGIYCKNFAPYRNGVRLFVRDWYTF